MDYSGTQAMPKAAREARIPASLNSLADALARMDNQISSLETRLEPVLLQPYPCDEAEKVGAADGSSVAVLLSSKVGIANQLTERLADIENRLDL